MQEQIQYPRFSERVKAAHEGLGSFGFVFLFFLFPILLPALLIYSPIRIPIIEDYASINILLTVIVTGFLGFLFDVFLYHIKTSDVFKRQTPWILLSLFCLSEWPIATLYLLLATCWFLFFHPFKKLIFTSFGVLGFWMILFFIFTFPHFVGTHCPAKISSVKSNMHTVQYLVDLYGKKYGQYPESIITLKTDALRSQPPYWKEPGPSPFKSVDKAKAFSYGDYSVLTFSTPGVVQLPYEKWFGIRFYWPWLIDVRGSVIYDGHSSHYWIYGMDKQGQFITERGLILTLSNS